MIVLIANTHRAISKRSSLQLNPEGSLPQRDPKGIVAQRDLEEIVASAKSCAEFGLMALAQKDQLLEIGSRVRL
ncbi:hypothetical protein, partial [Mesorhizobium sp.]